LQRTAYDFGVSITRTFLGVTVAIVLGAGLTACSSDGPVESADTPTAASSTPTRATSPSTKAAEAGTRANPFGYGKAVRYDDTSVWTFTWQGTEPDAYEQVKAQNEFATPPPTSSSFILGSFAVGAGPDMPADGADPNASWGVSYVGNDGNTYDYDASCGVIQDELFSAGTMYANASKTLKVCATVPTTAVSGGTWLIRSYVGADSSVYFKGA